MRPSIVAIACLLAFSGCDTDQERMAKAMEKQIQETIEIDWHGGIPLDRLLDAEKLCEKNPALHGCDGIQAQLKDIAITYFSCKEDSLSRLCQAVVKEIGSYPEFPLISDAEPKKLPHSPWYLSLPTTALEAQAGHFGYRKQVVSWWWDSWRTIILSCLALLFASYSAWKIYKIQQAENQKRQYLVAQQKAELAKQERIRKEQESRARAEAEHRARREREFAIAEQNKIAAEQAARMKADAVADKLAAEQAEAAELLNSVFKQSSSKRGGE